MYSFIHVFTVCMPQHSEATMVTTLNWGFLLGIPVESADCFQLKLQEIPQIIDTSFGTSCFLFNFIHRYEVIHYCVQCVQHRLYVWWYQNFHRPPLVQATASWSRIMMLKVFAYRRRFRLDSKPQQPDEAKFISGIQTSDEHTQRWTAREPLRRMESFTLAWVQKSRKEQQEGASKAPNAA